MDDDYLLAIQLQEQFDHEFESSKDDNFGNQSSKKRKIDLASGGNVVSYSHQSASAERPMSIVDEAWETLDPIPDVRAMFLEFNDTFFWGKLCGVEVKWSPRMTLCAGVCSYEGRGGLCSIRLSEPLLKLRPRRDLVETLLHEMIHALLFVTQNNRDRDGHGPEFCKHMKRINQATGTKITVYHTFNDEVDLYRQHWWRCDGPCQNRKPYFGYVKRAMNRAPSSLDPWWRDHQHSCGGAYIKVKEPEGYGKKGGTKSNKEKNKPANRISPFSQPTSKTTSLHNSQPTSKTTSLHNSQPTSKTTSLHNSQPTSKATSISAASGSQDIRNVIPFSGKGFLLGGSSSSSSSSKRPPPDLGLSQPKTPSPPLSPPAKLRGPLSPLSPGQGNPDRAGSLWAPPSTSGVTRGPKPTVKRSVSNTKVFVNINGSPVRIPKASPATTVSKPSGANRANELLSASEDLFSTRTSVEGASKSPEEVKGEQLRSTEDVNAQQATSAKTMSPLGAWLQSGPRLSPAKPGQSRTPSAGSNRPSGRITGSGSGPGGGPPPVSRKRPWDDRTSSHMFDFFQKQVGSETSSSPSSSSSGSRDGKAGVSASAGVSGWAAQQRAADPSSSSSVQRKTASPTFSSSSSSSSSSVQMNIAGPSSSSSSSSSMATLTVSCPVCQAKVQEAKINQHLDSCLS